MTGAPAALQVRDLTVRFGMRTALQGVQLDARPGEFVALTGPNGSGKTTLLRCALGLTTPSEGTVRLFGAETGKLSVRERARRVAWVPQDESPRDNVRIASYVLYGRYAHLGAFEGESREDRAIAAAALADVGLSDRRDDGIWELSGGERQRLLLARALAQGSPILLLDEPTAHLDIGHQLDLLGRVRELVRQRRVCAVAALHDLNLAARFADRLTVLSHGRKVADGPPSEVLAVPLLREVWGIEAEVRRDPLSGQPYLLPRRLAEPIRPRATVHRGPGLIHVVGGGGSASPILRALFESGYTVSAGALPLLDSDAETCEELGIPYVAEIPFAPLSPEVRARHRRQLDDAQIILVAPFAVGPSNVANLEDLVGRPGHQGVVLVDGPAGVRRDFTDGRATELLTQLEVEGARRAGDLATVLRMLAEPRPPGS